MNDDKRPPAADRSTAPTQSRTSTASSNPADQSVETTEASSGDVPHAYHGQDGRAPTAGQNDSSQRPQWMFALGAVAVLIALGVALYQVRSPATDYVPLALVFLSAVAAVAGTSWDDSKVGISRVTLKGRILVAIALLGLVVGIRNTQINHAKLEAVEDVRDIAHLRLVKGLSMILHPITSSWKEPPKKDIDMLAKAKEITTVSALAKTRLVPFSDPVEDFMAMLDGPASFQTTANGTRVVSSCGAPHREFRALYELFDFCVDGGEAILRETEQTFLSHLEPTTIVLLHAVLEDEFYLEKYRNLSQHEQLFYQGLHDEAGVGTDPARSDRTWLALLELVRASRPEAKGPSEENPKQEPSAWLYLGTYYFGPNVDSAAYQEFLGKVDALVRHIDALTGSDHLLETF